MFTIIKNREYKFVNRAHIVLIAASSQSRMNNSFINELCNPIL